jgi:hypothetical protein
MPRILHILTRSDDALPREIIARQTAGGENEVRIADLTVVQPDYKAMLEEIFAADSVETW